MRFFLLIVLIYSYSSLTAQVNAVLDSIEGKEDSTLIINVQANDLVEAGCVNQTTVTIQAINGTATVHSDNISVKYVPNASFFGQDSIQYKIKGCVSGQESFNWIKIDVIPINQKPNAKTDYYTINEDEIKMLGVQSNDTDRESTNLSTTMEVPAKHGLAVIATT